MKTLTKVELQAGITESEALIQRTIGRIELMKALLQNYEIAEKEPEAPVKEGVPLELAK